MVRECHATRTPDVMLVSDLHPTYCGLGKECTCQRIDYCVMQPSRHPSLYRDARIITARMRRVAYDLFIDPDVPRYIKEKMQDIMDYAGQVGDPSVGAYDKTSWEQNADKAREIKELELVSISAVSDPLPHHTLNVVDPKQRGKCMHKWSVSEPSTCLLCGVEAEQRCHCGKTPSA